MYLIFVPSLNKNVQLANILKKQLSTIGEESQIIHLVDYNLPLYDTDKEEKNGIPEEIVNISKVMLEAKAYIFVVPEYNYGLPPVLVNFITWVTRTGDDFRKLFNHKVVQLASHSGGNGIDLLNAMRTQFSKLGSVVMPREILATYNKPLREEHALKILQELVEFMDEHPKNS